MPAEQLRAQSHLKEFNVQIQQHMQSLFFKERNVIVNSLVAFTTETSFDDGRARCTDIVNAFETQAEQLYAPLHLAPLGSALRDRLAPLGSARLGSARPSWLGSALRDRLGPLGSARVDLWRSARSRSRRPQSR